MNDVYANLGFIMPRLNLKAHQTFVIELTKQKLYRDSSIVKCQKRKIIT